MSENLAIFVLLVIAIGIGFLLGRWNIHRKQMPENTAPGDFDGLNPALTNQHELAIDSFIESMAVNDNTVATHLALGSLVRRQGEVEKAIKIHQNLLARPVLAAVNRTQTELELARDYLLAGLLDRAEHLLRQLVEKKGDIRRAALQHLVQIYQREREWQKAIDMGTKLVSRQNSEIKRELAHFLCELAEETLAQGDTAVARRQLLKAESYDSECPRVYLLLAKVNFQNRQYRETLKHLRKAADLDAGLIPETLELYQNTSLELGRPQQYRAYLEYAAARSGALEVVESLYRSITTEQGPTAAMAFLNHQLELHPTFEILDLYLTEVGAAASGNSLHDELKPARSLLKKVLTRQASHVCTNCGFSSHSLLWQCPSCQSWGTSQRRHSSEIAGA